MSLPSRPPTRTATAPDARRWAALVVIALAQLMVVVDATIVNIALPSAARDLGLSVADRQWVVTAYTIAFGGLLLLGGRVADLAGRKRTFCIGLVGFAAASAVAGASTGFTMLISARAAQGAFGALLAPSALSLISVTFSDPRERAKAFGIFGGVAAGGSAIGLLLGGVLTDYLNWTWCLYVNVPIAALALAAAVPTLREHRAPRTGGYDLVGAALVTAGLVSLVYGCSKAETDGWGAGRTIGTLVAGGVLLALFVLTERTVRNPLLPLRIPADRTRGGAYLAVLAAVLGMFAVLFFLTFYLQQVQDYSPTRAGVAFLPMTAGVVAAAGFSSRVGSHLRPGRVLGTGLLTVAVGMGLLTRLRVGSSYAAVVLPVLIVVGVGMGLVMITAVNAATDRVHEGDTGVASATVNAAQQVGASLGTALLSTIAASAAATYASNHLRAHAGRAAATAARLQAVQTHATVHGYTVAAWYGAAILFAAALGVYALVNAPAATADAAASPRSRDTVAAG